MNWFKVTIKPEEKFTPIKTEEEKFRPYVPQNEEEKFKPFIPHVKPEEEEKKFKPYIPAGDQEKFKPYIPQIKPENDRKIKPSKNDQIKRIYPQLEPIYPKSVDDSFIDVKKSDFTFEDVVKAKEMIKKIYEPTKLPPINSGPIKPYIPKLSTATKKICSSKYDALQIHGYFGLIHDGVGWCGEDILIVHTPSRQSKDHMLSIKEGDEIYIVRLKEKTNNILTVRYVTRYKYYSPGVAVSTVQIGVDGWL